MDGNRLLIVDLAPQLLRQPFRYCPFLPWLRPISALPFFFPPFPFPFRFRFRFRLIDKCSKSFWLHYDIQRYDVVEWFLHWRVLYISYYTNRLAFVDAIKLKPAEVYFLYSFILFLNALHFPFVRNPWIGMNVGKKKTRDGTNLTAIRLDQIHISLFWECF